MMVHVTFVKVWMALPEFSMVAFTDWSTKGYSLLLECESKEDMPTSSTSQGAGPSLGASLVVPPIMETKGAPSKETAMMRTKRAELGVLLSFWDSSFPVILRDTTSGFKTGYICVERTCNI